MTTLAKLKTMKDAEIQDWLRKVGKDHVTTLVLALLGADDEVKKCVFRNMSERARTRLKEDMDQYTTRNVDEKIIKENASELEKLMVSIGNPIVKPGRM